MYLRTFRSIVVPLASWSCCFRRLAAPADGERTASLSEWRCCTLGETWWTGCLSTRTVAIRNVLHSPVDALSRPRRLEFSTTSLWEPKISQKYRLPCVLIWGRHDLAICIFWWVFKPSVPVVKFELFSGTCCTFLLSYWQSISESRRLATKLDDVKDQTFHKSRMHGKLVSWGVCYRFIAVGFTLQSYLLLWCRRVELHDC